MKPPVTTAIDHGLGGGGDAPLSSPSGSGRGGGGDAPLSITIEIAKLVKKVIAIAIVTVRKRRRIDFCDILLPPVGD
jgi:hypothetical protein